MSQILRFSNEKITVRNLIEAFHKDELEKELDFEILDEEGSEEVELVQIKRSQGIILQLKREKK